MFKKEINQIRFLILSICNKTKEGHIGSSLSILEIVFIILKKFCKKNFFILSKGHASIAVYAVMNYFKILNDNEYNSFCKFSSKLGGHPDSTKIPFFNFSTGSLGHGLPVSTGFAYSLKYKKSKKKIICIIGDQELMEGTTWESLHIIENYKLDNIVLIIDRNNSDFRSIKFLNIKKKLSVFSERIVEVDGHNISELDKEISKSLKNRLFNIIIANTVKGKGLMSVENNPEWHHKIPSDEDLINFKKELNL
jgi:transketolase